MGCDSDSDCAGTNKPHCLHEDHLCGKGMKGECFGCPCGGEGCIHSFERVCGCGGEIVTPPSGCDAFEYQRDASICSKGTFACGATQCKQYIEYCIPSGPNAGCLPVPDLCAYGTVDCNCATHYKADGFCTNDGQGGVNVLCGPPGGVCSAMTPCCGGTECRKGVCQPCGGFGTDCSATGTDACCAPLACGDTATAGVQACASCVGDGGKPVAVNGVAPPCCCATPFDPVLGVCHALPNGVGAVCDKDCLCASGDCDATGHCK